MARIKAFINQKHWTKPGINQAKTGSKHFPKRSKTASNPDQNQHQQFHIQIIKHSL